MSKPVLPAKRRRKGFESVRKGYRSADARLIFFENGLLYCKLTAASAIPKGLLHVSFCAVGSWSFAVLKWVFSLSDCFAWAEKTPLSRIKKIFISRNFTNLTQGRFLRTKTSFAHAFLRCPQKFSFSQTKRFSFAESFTNYPQKPPFFTYKKPFIRTNLFYCHPKQSFFALRLPFAPPLTYCPQKNSIFTNQKLSFAQTFPYCYPKLLFSTLHLPFAPPLTYCPKRIQLFFCCSL